MKLLVHLLLLIGLSGLTGAAIVGHQSADLSTIKDGDSAMGPVTDLADLLAQATIKRSAPIEITESDLNRYLAATMRGRQSGRSARAIQFEKCLVDLEAGYARITLCWMLDGHRTSASIDLRLDSKSGEHEAEILSGAYGRMPVARGFLSPLMPAFASLSATCGPEIKSILSMTKIRLLKDKLVLDPRY